MADLSSLIRLHKHDLDEKRRALGELYAALAALARRRRDLDIALEREKEAMRAGGDVHFTFASFVEKVRQEKKEIEESEAGLEKKIEEARDSLMETFTELKKYEMTQAERDRLEAAERAFREAQALDEIGLEGFRRREDENA